MGKRLTWGLATAATLVAVAVGGGRVRHHLLIRTAPPPQELLRRAMQADWEAADYSGETETATFVRGGQCKARAHILHRAPGKYKVTYLTGPQAGMTVGSDGIMAWRCAAEGDVIEVTNATLAPDEADKRFDLLLKNYSIALSGSEVVAARPTWVLDVKPLHHGNAWKRFWIDREHSVILRTDSYDGRGRLRARSIFHSIQFDVELSDLVFVLPSDAPSEAYHTVQPHESARAFGLADLSSRIGFQPRLPRHVPPGYTVEGYYLFDHRCCEGKSAIIRYVDGLNSISVFEASVRNDALNSPHKLSGLGWVADQFGSSNVVSLLNTHPQVVIVGDLSRAELLRMADSLK